MSHLPMISGRKAVAAFSRLGWVERGQVGSHVVMTKHGVPVNLTVPSHKELATGTLRRLIRDAGISIDDFMCLL